ncbi:MAG: hypothetical protein Q8L87_05160 [Anaerolineales bacterium]|nr:hypothetical protein [Anaerolineales bacterium]
MEVTRLENLPPPPGIINSIRAGFDTIASHITAILLPLLLNLLMWLGPRLRMDEFFNSLEDGMVAIWRNGGIPSEDIQRVLDWYETTIPAINLFWLVRTLPVGISNLLLSNGTDSTPMGDPAIWQVSGISLPGWILLLTFIGWVGGALYFRSVAWIVTVEKEKSVRTYNAILQTVLLSILFGIILFVIGMPLLLVLFLLAQLNAFVANLFVLFLSLGSVWVIVPLFFWSHGIFLDRQNVFASMLSSIQLTRFTLPTSSLFVLTVFLLAYGLNFLWRIPTEDSWLTLFGIFGHSFVTTALLAGSFIYYRDMKAWLKDVLEKLRPVNSVHQA